MQNKEKRKADAVFFLVCAATLDLPGNAFLVSGFLVGLPITRLRTRCQRLKQTRAFQRRSGFLTGNGVDSIQRGGFAHSKVPQTNQTHFVAPLRCDNGHAMVAVDDISGAHLLRPVFTWQLVRSISVFCILNVLLSQSTCTNIIDELEMFVSFNVHT